MIPDTEMKQAIYVTQPSLAPLEEVVEILKGVWDRNILTNNGPVFLELEKKLKEKLGLSNLAIVSNGTIAIQMAIKALELKGEIITTPFTWLATVSAIKWENCVPVFCDINPETLNIDVQKLEEQITPNTVAIMPVHVFGNPCDVLAIEAIAKKHNLKVIYDAAHAIGSTFNGETVLNWGDISATSLHATKMLNTGEGGACIAKDNELLEKLRRIRFFGHNDAKDVVEDGLNAKLTEIHAALGLANLKYFDEILADRKSKYLLYKEILSQSPRLSFQLNQHGETNFSYFPVLFENEEVLFKVEKNLAKENIFPRRYFWPSVNTYSKIVPYSACPISEAVSSRILCLPHYKGLSVSNVERIAGIVLASVNED